MTKRKLKKTIRVMLSLPDMRVACYQVSPPETVSREIEAYREVRAEMKKKKEKAGTAPLLKKKLIPEPGSRLHDYEKKLKIQEQVRQGALKSKAPIFPSLDPLMLTELETKKLLYEHIVHQKQALQAIHRIPKEYQSK